MSKREECLRVLGIDLALTTGYAFCEFDARGYLQVLESGIIDARVRNEPSPLTENTYVRRLHHFGRVLDAVILGKLEYLHRAKQVRPVDIVAYELAPWRAKRGTSARVRDMALRLSGVLLEHLYYLGGIEVEILRVAPQTWQPAVFGDKYKPKQSSVVRKKLSIDHCRSLGYRPENHDIADAVNIAYYIARKRLDA